MTTARNYVSNALPSTLSAGVGSSGSISVVQMPGTWPTAYPYTLLIDWGTTIQEAVLVTGAATGSGPYALPCTRGIDGTTAQAHSIGAVVVHGTTSYEPTLLASLGGSIITPTTQTTTYTANPGDLVKADVSGGGWTMKLPNAPTPYSTVAAKIITNVTTGAPNVLTVACQGSDVFEKSGGAASATLSLLDQSAVWQYNSGFWTRISDNLPLGSLDARYANVFSPLAYGAAGNGTTDDTTALQDCVAAAVAVKGVVDLGTYTFKTSSPVNITTGFHMKGAGYQGGSITNSASDLFTIASSVSYVTFEGCTFTSGSGGGHIWNASNGPSMSFVKILGCVVTQNNGGKAIWYQIGGDFIDCLVDQQCNFICAQAATVSPMSWLRTPGTFNSVQFKRMRCTANGAAAVPFFTIDPGYGAHTDTSVGFTASSPTVTDASAVSGDLGLFIYSSNFSGGSATITAVTPGTGYTVNKNATSNLSGQTCLIGAEGWVEDISWDSVTWEVCTGGGIAMTGCVDVEISLCNNWDIPAPRTDTGCGTTNTSATVTDSSAVTGDLGKSITGTGIPAGSYITAVTASTGYTISQNATATNSGLSLVVGGQAANFYSFTKSATGYPARSVTVRGGRTGGVTAGTGFYDFYADTNSTNIKLESMGAWASAPVVSSPALQTTIINPTVPNTTTAPVTTAPILSIAGNTGATAGSRYAGATASGAPASGTYAVGDFVVDQTGSMWVCTAAGTPGTWAQVGSGSGANVQWFTSNGTWTKPGGASTVEVLLLSGGAGGGSGRRGTSSNIACGGGGGGGAPGMYRIFSAADLSGTVSVTIGAGGAGGLAVTTDNTSGANGSDGTNSSFGAYCYSYVSLFGSGGTTSTGTGGGIETSMIPGAAGTPASTTGLAGVAANTAGGGGGGGGAGGGISGATPTASLGGGGGATTGGSSSNTGAAGVIDTTQPTAGTQPAVKGTPSCGGAGGCSSVTTAAQNGATAYYGGGGGGGGASLNGSNSGAGGTGGPGYCLVITHFS